MTVELDIEVAEPERIDLTAALHIVPVDSTYRHVARPDCRCCPTGGWVGIGSLRPVLRHRDPGRRIRNEPWRGQGAVVTGAETDREP